ncbi:hypothetical protein A0J61_06502 [Choanephora cucurbitarum]|uniref:Myb-like domain-containing protein n=2 Tax=Choanephora cucurbitarum TaxID=101091 RepID=A0A1C7N8K7_9FUNG|nr:hypothetical protein A0J61_06502 [Choanephora cucurbitarum]
MYMNSRKKRDSPEAKRWLIVGAFQAGASEKHIARISGLSRTAVRNIILNYRRTGIPCLPKKIPNKIRQKLIVEYDENGEIILTDEDEQEEQKQVSSRRSRRGSRKSNTMWHEKDIDPVAINSFNDMRISGPASTSQDTSSNHYSTLFEPSSSQSQPARLPPPTKYDQDIRGYELWTHEDDILLLSYVLYSLRGGGWSELEARFNGRHSARLCYDRWKYLKSLLLKNLLDKPNATW